TVSSSVDGDHDLVVGGLVDAVGNAGVDTTLGVLHVDGTAPALAAAIDDEVARYSRVAGHDTVSFHYDAEAGAIVSVDDGAALSSPACAPPGVDDTVACTAAVAAD